MCGGDVEDGKGRVDLSGLPRDLPSIKPAPQTDVGHKRAVFVLVAFEKGDCFFAGRRDRRFKPAIRKSVFNDELNRRVVFDNQNYKLVFQRLYSPCGQPKTSRRNRVFVPGRMYKSALSDFGATLPGTAGVAIEAWPKDGKPGPLDGFYMSGTVLKTGKDVTTPRPGR
jgi:hypothetical protein